MFWKPSRPSGVVSQVLENWPTPWAKTSGYFRAATGFGKTHRHGRRDRYVRENRSAPCRLWQSCPVRQFSAPGVENMLSGTTPYSYRLQASFSYRALSLYFRFLQSVVTAACNRNGGNGIFKLFHRLGCKTNIGRPQVLFEVRKFRRAGNGNDKGFLFSSHARATCAGVMPLVLPKALSTSTMRMFCRMASG